MTNNPARRFWQVHLSTLMVLVLSAGGLMAFHILPRGERARFWEETVEMQQYGFPFVYFEGFSTVTDSGSITSQSSTHVPCAGILNFIVVLFPVAALCEFWIRKKEAPQAGRGLWPLHLVPGLLALAIATILFMANGNEVFMSSHSAEGPENSWSTSITLRRGWPQSSLASVTASLKHGTLIFSDGENDCGSIPYLTRYDAAVVDALILEEAKLPVSWPLIFRNAAAGAFIVLSTLIFFELLWRRWRGQAIAVLNPEGS